MGSTDRRGSVVSVWRCQTDKEGERWTSGFEVWKCMTLHMIETTDDKGH